MYVGDRFQHIFILSFLTHRLMFFPYSAHQMFKTQSAVSMQAFEIFQSKDGRTICVIKLNLYKI